MSCPPAIGSEGLLLPPDIAAGRNYCLAVDIEREKAVISKYCPRFYEKTSKWKE
jgi:hypothetical protein